MEHTDVTYTTLVPGSIAHYTCHLGYKFTFHEYYRNATCLKSGKWDIPIVCTGMDICFHNELFVYNMSYLSTT